MANELNNNDKLNKKNIGDKSNQICQYVIYKLD